MYEWIDTIVGNKLMVYDGICTEDQPYTGVYLFVTRMFSVFHVIDSVHAVDFPANNRNKKPNERQRRRKR